jgi:hypothetical protein
MSLQINKIPHSAQLDRSARPRMTRYCCDQVLLYADCFVNFVEILLPDSGPGSSVCIATDYGLDGPGIESRWGRDVPHVQTGPRVHSASYTVGTGSFPGVKCGQSVLLTPHPLIAPRSWKSRGIPQPPSGPKPGL